MKKAFPRVNDKIKNRRLELGLKDLEVAYKSGLSIHQYNDLEDYPDYIFAAAPLYYVKKVCRALDIDLNNVFGISCVFCEDQQPYLEEYRSWRCTLVKVKREKLGLSTEKLGDEVGFYGSEIELIEKYPAHLESWVIENILELAKQLEVPPQILLDTQCLKCGR